MALDSSFRRGDSTDAQQAGENTDEFMHTRLPAVRPSATGISVMLWDEVEPALHRTTQPLADDSPET